MALALRANFYKARAKFAPDVNNVTAIQAPMIVSPFHIGNTIEHALLDCDYRCCWRGHANFSTGNSAASTHVIATYGGFVCLADHVGELYDDD
jgi:hypothetical protein